MIAIVSHLPRERAAFSALCASRGWPVVECDSLRSLRRQLVRATPHVVLTRHKLPDGYSDDVIAAVAGDAGAAARIIVLIGAGSTSALEARQVALGADCVQRDPVRTDVLLEYIAKYRKRAAAPPARRRPAPATVRFAGGSLLVPERRLEHSGRSVALTPRETTLVQLLAHAGGEVLSYETLYAEILGRRFQGDTSNMRVLLGKLGASLARVGISLRDWVEVIPKAGYCYRPAAPRGLKIAAPRRRLLPAA